MDVRLPISLDNQGGIFPGAHFQIALLLVGLANATDRFAFVDDLFQFPSGGAANLY
jgi:hypothetical protein